MPIMPASISETINITENGSHNVAKYTMANVSVDPVVESLNVTPTTSAQSLTPTTGVDGFNEVNVSAVTSSIDNNIQAGNIKSGVSILGVTGSYEGSGGGETIIYGINAKGWCGDLQTVGGQTTMRTDQAIGTLTGLNTITSIDHWNKKFKGSTGLVGAVDLSSLRSGDLNSAFEGTRITSLNLKNFVGNSCLYKICKDNSALTSVNLSLLRHLQVDPNMEYEYSNSSNIQYGFQNCTGLRELRLPSIRLDSWFWFYDYDEETGDEYIDYLYGISGSFTGFIKGCTNLVLHFSSSLGNDLASLSGGSDRFFDILCDYDSTTKTNCSIVYDLPPNDPISVRITGGYDGQVDRYPGGDTNSSLAWYYYNYSSNSNQVLYTNGLLEPEVNDTIYSDPECTTSIGTVAEVYPVYDGNEEEYYEEEPEPEEPEE